MGEQASGGRHQATATLEDASGVIRGVAERERSETVVVKEEQEDGSMEAVMEMRRSVRIESRRQRELRLKEELERVETSEEDVQSEAGSQRTTDKDLASGTTETGKDGKNESKKQMEKQRVRWTNKDYRELYEAYQESLLEGKRGFAERMLAGWLRRGRDVVEKGALLRRLKTAKTIGMSGVEREDIRRRVQERWAGCGLRDYVEQKTSGQKKGDAGRRAEEALG